MHQDYPPINLKLNSELALENLALPPRYVFTGAPCAGKTETAKALAAMHPDWLVLEEAARFFSIEDRNDEARFSQMVLEKKVQMEKELSLDQVIIFDRGIPCSIAYFELSDLSLEVFESLAIDKRYSIIFNFAPLEFVQDELRNDFDQAFAARLKLRLPEIYRELGYSVIEVPVMLIEERARLVSEIIEKN